MTRSLILLLASAACQPAIDEAPIVEPCVDTPGLTDIHAVELYATSSSGQPLIDAAASWRVDDGEWAPCLELSTTSWLCGPNITGPITVQVQAPGHQPEQLTPVVIEDACGDPVTRRVDLVLDGVPCPPGMVPAVDVAVFGRLTDTFVSWHMAAEDGPWERCDSAGGRPPRFACAMNQTGLIEVGAYTEGVLVLSETVDVGLDRDRCFPVTQQVVFDLGQG